MIEIDGGRGEGGGQVLRSALALSLLSGEPFRITAIRSGRRKPGLLRQHLTAVRAALAVCQDASADGAVLGSAELCFRPGTVCPGDYRFAIGTAGSTALVLQTVLLPLALADGPSTVTLEGGTHNPYAPPFDFLAAVFLPQLRALGLQVDAQLDHYGFYPAGGGRCVFRITPLPSRCWQPLDLGGRGELLEREAVATWANLPTHVAERELAALSESLDWPPEYCRYRELSGYSGVGNYLSVRLVHERVCELFSGFGAVGVSAEQVAADCTRQAQRYLAAEVAAGEYLADQLLLPLALAGGEFTTLEPSDHSLTNIAVIEQFLGARFRLSELAPDRWQVTV